MKVETKVIGCGAAMELMSPFIDSMVTGEESECLRRHVSECARCERQLRSFVSLRSVMAAVEPVPVPEDLQLDTRVRLSRVRADNQRERWQSRIDNILKPLAVPAVSGIVLTSFFFFFLFGYLAAPRGVQANTDVSGSVVAFYAPPRTTDRTANRFGRSISPELEQALSVQTEVSDTGRIYDYSIIGGTRSAGVDQWLQEVLLLAQFRPATNYMGSPVPSRVILSFVNVRG